MIANGFAYLSHFSDIFEVQIWECSGQVTLKKKCARKIDTNTKDEPTCLVLPWSPILDSVLMTIKWSLSCPNGSKGMSAFYFLMYFWLEEKLTYRYNSPIEFGTSQRFKKHYVWKSFPYDCHNNFLRTHTYKVVTSTLRVHACGLGQASMITAKEKRFPGPPDLLSTTDPGRSGELFHLCILTSPGNWNT